MLVVPTAGPNLAVALTGTGMIGTTKLTLAGRYPTGNPTRLALLVAEGVTNPRGGPGDFRFNALGFDQGRLEITLDGSHPLQKGRHDTGSIDHDDMDGRVVFDLLAGFRCRDLYGHETVASFTTDADNQPTSADLTFSQHCVTSATEQRDFTGRLRWQDRGDRTAPRRPSQLTADPSTVRWHNSGTSDRSHTVVRVFPATTSRYGPTGGSAVYSGKATSAELPSLVAGHQYTIAAFSVDRTGNVSAPRTVIITA